MIRSPHRSRRVLVTAAVGAVVALGAAGCVSSGGSSSSASGGNAWATATSAQAGGGTDALVAAAKAEGTLNVIALPPDWANYGNIIKGFSDKYGIKVDSANPDGSSQDEINAVKQLGTQDRAPDVLDLGQSFALGNVDLYAPYKVATFDSIPAANKDANGAWVNDYGGYISIGCNSTLVPVCPTSFADLAKPEYAGKVALNGDPTQAASAFASVWAGALANGGSLDDITPGVTFWGSVAKSGNLLKVDPNSATIQSGQTPIVLDWDYLNVAETEKNKASFDWKVAVPTDGLFAQYYAQAINKNAPHPAAARLWQEFLYSDEGQNLWLAGKARPIRLEAMTAGGTADKALLAALPPVSGEARFPTQAQTDAANKVVAQNWATATS
ncbi:MAG: substrate-binding transporter [Pseudonocardia sp.]|jgi:putative spermidine/putrescine transport system substrate-binding protein|uniref:ABC transporter substrate-binding protein n=1 Tax=Pseudonocardia sp. TaxID=60912 RepID=UPI002606ABDA|nr:ABC transporter substrate-binding protein [Pseudonocardia sp.]MCU1626736.1 substrate-binding transporter [Pseudonocardia sp.]HEV7469733.1 ABC transporter substrate-binding protein [Pseudonocardia sp.]